MTATGDFRPEHPLGSALGYNPQFLARVNAARQERREREILRQEAERLERERLALEERRRVEAEYAAALAEQTARAVEVDRPRALDVLRHAAMQNGLSLDDVYGRSRASPVVARRDLVLIAVRAARPDMSLSQLGRLFKRDHTSIRAALIRNGIPTVGAIE